MSNDSVGSGGGGSGDNSGGNSVPAFNDTVCCERHGKPEGAFMPPLPDSVVLATQFTHGSGSPSAWDGAGSPASVAHMAGPYFGQPGCYYIRLTPTSLQTAPRYQYEGTLRIRRVGAAVSASGDLYKSDVCKDPVYIPSFTGDQSGAAGIPVFPRKHYGFYLRVSRLQLQAAGDSVGRMEMDMFRFDQSNHTWASPEPVTVDFYLSTSSDGIHYWRGDLKNNAGIVKGNFLIVHIADHLRQAVVEIDRVKESPVPVMEPEARFPGERWREVFKKAHWDVTLDISDGNIEEPADQSWSNGELHEAMTVNRGEEKLDREWRYHLLAVKNLDDGAFGIMYDNTIKGVNDIPREGAAVASHVTFSDLKDWGDYKDKPFYSCKEAYVRTSIHEIGHAMMLYHPDNPYENYIMQRTENIASHSSSRKSFPHSIEWSFSPRDIHMLCHLPDIAIRPGGISFGTPHQRIPGNAREEVMEAEGLCLTLEALSPVLPIGAPMRIMYTLENNSDVPQVAPSSIRMKTGHVSGKVIDPLGAAQDFATIMVYTTNDVLAEKTTQVLKPGESMSHAATLLWGADGPLCPTSGFYRVIVQLDWYVDGMRKRIAGNLGLMVTPPENEKHANAALDIFSTPKTLLALAIGGRHIKEGNAAIEAAMDCEQLKNHYAVIRAKRKGNRHFDVPPDLNAAADGLDIDTHMTVPELVRLSGIIKKYMKQTFKTNLEKLVSVLEHKMKDEKILKKMKDEDQGVVNGNIAAISAYISS